MKGLTVYQNGWYRVVPLIKGYRVVAHDGRVIYPHYEPTEIDMAVEDVDELAIADGVYRAVA